MKNRNLTDRDGTLYFEKHPNDDTIFDSIEYVLDRAYDQGITLSVTITPLLKLFKVSVANEDLTRFVNTFMQDSTFPPLANTK